MQAVKIQLQVRFFSFLIGEEATDVAQVKWMACENKGFMVHITNLADVQEKVQVSNVTQCLRHFLVPIIIKIFTCNHKWSNVVSSNLF